MVSILFCLLSAQVPPQSTLPPPQSTLESDYRDPRDEFRRVKAESLRTGKPVVAWVGGNFCERCVNDSANEFLHVFVEDGWDGNRGPATAVLVPHDGYLYYAGVVTRWTVGSRDWGHVPSARRIAAEWRARAVRGETGQLRLLNFGDGSWGMSHDVFWRNYQGGGHNYRATPSRSSRSGRGGGC